MRISDWSSDVCSSDLLVRQIGDERFLHPEHGVGVEIGAFGREDMGGQAFEAFLSDHEVNMRGTIGVPFRRREHLAHRAVVRDGIVRRNDGPEAEAPFLVGPEPRTKRCIVAVRRSEEHTSELQSLLRISYAVFCLKKKKNRNKA